jgi:tetratricopeptide (TPR) repeat protein
MASGSSEVARAANNLAVCEWVLGDLRQAILLMDDAIAHSERLGLATLLRFAQNVKHWMLFRTGDWDVALPYTDEFIAAVEDGEPHYHEGGMRMRRAFVRLARDDVEGALDDLGKTVLLARQAGDPQQRIPWFCEAARLFVEAGELEEARRLTPEALQAGAANASWGFVELAYVARELECGDDLAKLLEHIPPTTWRTAAQALVAGDFGDAADLLEEIGDEQLAALARLRAAEQLVAKGRRSEADEQLQRSLAFWRRVGAPHYVRRAEALLAATS